MNHCYRSLWNDALGAWVAAAETTRTNGKRSTARTAIAAAAAVLSMAVPVGAAWADTAIGPAKIDNAGGAVCTTPDRPSTSASTWTCQVPNGNGGFATVSGLPGAANGYPDTAALSTWVSENLGAHAIAIGSMDTSAAGEYAIAIGAYASAGGKYSIAMGTNAQAAGRGTIAIGDVAGVGSTAEQSVHLGHQAGQFSEGQFNTAVGMAAGTNVKGSNNAAFGNGAGSLVTGNANTASGYSSGTNVTGDQNAAFGGSAGMGTQGDANTAVGYGAGIGVRGNANTAVGNLAGTVFSGNNNTAMGYTAGSGVTGNDNASLGSWSGAFLQGNNNVAAGSAAASLVSGNNNIAAGTSAGVGIQGSNNVAIGRAAGTGIQLDWATGKVLDRHGNDIPDDPPFTLPALNDAVAIGDLAITDADRSIAIGKNALAGAAGKPDAIAIGTGAQATGERSISIGTGNVVSGARSGAIGDPTYITGDDSYAIGNNNKIDASRTFVLGNDVTVAAGLDGAVALGDGSTVSASKGAAYNPGTGIVAGAPNAAGSNVVSVGAAGSERRITNVAAGSAPSDAVNVSQLQSLAGTVEAGQVHYYSVKSAAVGAGSNRDNDGAQGANSLAAGANASTTSAAANAVAVGGYAAASAADATAVGGASTAANAARAQGARATALGWGATAAGADSVAIGDSTAQANAIAVGRYASANTYGVAIGHSADANQQGSVAIGQSAYAGVDAIHIGTSSVNGNRSNHTGAFRRGSTLIGDSANSQGLYSTVIGNSNNLLVNQNITATGLLGSQFVAQGAFSNILGAYNTVGTRGTSTTDTTTNSKVYSGVAVTVAGSANNVQDSNGVFVSGYGNTVTNSYDDQIDVSGIHESLNAGSLASLIRDNGTKLGQVGVIGAGNTLDNGNNVLLMGMRSKVSDAVMSSVQGFGNEASGIENTFIAGASNQVSDAKNAFIAGTGNSVAGVRNVLAIGSEQSLDGASQSVLLGDRIAFDGKEAVAVGSDTQVADRAVALGDGAAATAVNSVALGAGAQATQDAAALAAKAAYAPGGATVAGLVPVGEVSVGTTGGERRITHVAAGADATDAVNVSQLRAVQEAAAAGEMHYYSVNSTVTGAGSNHDNKGATGTNTLAAGVNAHAAEINAVSVGTGATSYAYSVAIGSDAHADQIGMNAVDGGVAIGSSAQTGYYTKGSVALGNEAKVIDGTNPVDYAVAIGQGATASHSYSVALGAGSTDKAVAQVSSATIPGVIATLKADGTVEYSPGPAITYGGFAGTATGVVSVGAAGAERQIVNVAPGAISKDSTDAVNGSQLYSVASQVNAISGNITTIVNNASSHFYSVNGGTSADGNYANNGATAAGAIASGINASATAGNAVAMGANASATTANSVALGAGSTTTAATPTSGTTIRGQDYTFAGGNPTGVVSVGSAGAERQIQNVAAGQLSATSTDAVNGSQLYATNQALETLSVTANAGINVTTAATGTGVAVGTSVANVGSGGVATYTAGNNMVLTQNGANVAFAVSDNPTFNSLTVGNTSITNNGVSIQGGPSMTTGGINAGGTAVTNVAPGVNGTDAVNVNQLNAGIGTVNQNVNALRSELAATRQDADAGTAGAMAMAGMPQAYMPGKGMLAAGVGYYEGQSAIAVGLSKISDNGKWVTKITGSANSRGRVGAAVGVGYQW